MVSRLLLAAHAETVWNDQMRFQGHTDVPLHDRGRRQALVLQQWLAREPLQVIVASDLCRAWQTAELVALPHGLPVEREPRLRELDFGAWEGLTYAEVEESDPLVLAAWQENSLSTSPSKGETLAALALRIQSFWDDLTKRPEDGTFLLVAHRGSLRVLLCLLLGITVERHWDFTLRSASLSEVDLRDKMPRLVHLNEQASEGSEALTAHRRGGA